MKSKNKKFIVILTISTFFLLNALALINGLAKTIDGKDATFNLDKEDPLGPEGYGAIIPSPNTMGRISIDGSNQGKFTLMDWLGGSTGYEEIVSYSGEDISLYYPTYLDDYISDSYTKTDINPWLDISWLNISAYNAEAETLSPFTLNSVFDYYVLGEGGSLNAPANNEHPLQIDVIVKSGGPKVLQFDWLMADPTAASYDYYLISPSGIYMDTNCYEEPIAHTISSGTELFNILIFTASEIGTYRLLFDVDHTDPSSLYLEFLDTQISSLPTGTVKFAGNSDGILSIEEGSYADWQSQWFRISGKKGDLFTLDLFEDYATGDEPIIDIWTPCGNGYLLDSGKVMGSHEIYFPKSGAAYISFTDIIFGDWYRYSLFLSKIETVQYTLGENLTTFMLSNEERKAIEFSLREDSIVRFNYTSLAPEFPEIYAFTAAKRFIYRDSSEFECFDINMRLMERTFGSTTFYYHYMPAGTYRAIIKNTVAGVDGVFQITSKVYDWADESVPVNNLSSPYLYPSELITLEFGADDYFPSIKDPIGIDIQLPEIGQFILNTTIWASDNPETATGFPSYLYMYNSTGPADYYSFGYPQPVFSLDGDSTVGDFLYIGSPTRWAGMAFDFSVLGASGTMEPYVYNGGWQLISEDSDGTSELTADGTIEFDITDSDFTGWDLGTGGLIIDPAITEADYYWMRLECTGDYSVGTVPIIQQLTLLNNTIEGNVFFRLLGETGYEYADYLGTGGITQPSTETGLEVNLDDDLGSSFNWEDRDSYIVRGSYPLIIGMEERTYKLIILPESWDYEGTVRIQFAIEDYWGYHHQETYDIPTISPTPSLHAIDITNYTLSGYSNLTGPYNNYGLTTQYDHTETTLGFAGDVSYFALHCHGNAYQWTQLIVTMQGVSNYELYLIQDLPWITNGGPNMEVATIDTNVGVNRTFEFGVFNEDFILLFQVEDVAVDIKFYISLSQYDTETLLTLDKKASYTPPIDIILVLAIVIPAAVGGAIVVVYVLKKKGKILTKRPS
ncbi:MAG: hypothetical protein CEE43_09435 [Promethearchaeota archaeon Loki_b32]|nr:MAG: hypothetical protein CEE43_09435 [Candidatus Lokiarchaeota archaeon Loki_b32]